MHLGAFSLSLAVKDLNASRSFYEKLGFHVIGGEATEGWLILRSGDARLGLFQGMFPNNLVTFNPGWDLGGEPTDEDFTDVRVIQEGLRAVGIDPVIPTDPDGTGPGRIVVIDPDGNQILIDQHVPAPDPTSATSDDAG